MSIFGLVIPVTGHSDDIVIIHRAVNSITISKDTLQAIFSMRLRKWPDGSPIKVFVLKGDNPTHISFCKITLNIYPHQLRRTWNRLVYSGTGQAPIEVSSSKQLLELVATTPGSIGYTERSFLNDTVRPVQPQL